jgi:hypothetical protein
MRKRPLLYSTIHPQIVILLYKRRNNKTFKASQCIGKQNVSSGRILRNCLSKGGNTRVADL